MLVHKNLYNIHICLAECNVHVGIRMYHKLLRKCSYIESPQNQLKFWMFLCVSRHAYQLDNRFLVFSNPYNIPELFSFFFLVQCITVLSQPIFTWMNNEMFLSVLFILMIMHNSSERLCLWLACYLKNLKTNVIFINHYILIFSALKKPSPGPTKARVFFPHANLPWFFNFNCVATKAYFTLKYHHNSVNICY